MEETVKTEVVNNTTQNKGNKNFNKDRKPRKEFKKNFEPKKKLLEEKVISITRVTKVTKGGRHFRFAATMVVGDGKGLVGIGTGKSIEVPEAIKKGIQAANKNLVKVQLVDGRTIPHEQIGKCGRAKVDEFGGIFWSWLVLRYGDYGTSPRYGWIYKEDAKKLYDIIQALYDTDGEYVVE